MNEVSLGVLLGLAVFGLVGGIGITAVGPGGVLPTIGLFVLTGLSPAQVAGTAILTHVATGALGSSAYLRSGELRRPHTRRTALLLAASAVVGTPVGVGVNAMVSHRVFGLVLGVVAAAAALLLVHRDRRGLVSHTHPRTSGVVVLGLGVSVFSGVVGIGGPMLTVPLLMVLGVPILESLASAQVQSVVIAGVGSLGYLLQGAVDWQLALLVGVPELVGVLLGWRVARAVPGRVLQWALVVALLALAPYLVLRG